MNPSHGVMDTGVDAAAKTLGVALQRIDVRTSADIDGALTAILRQHAEAVLFYPLRLDPLDGPRIRDFMIKHRLPFSSAFRASVAAWGLMFYGPSVMGQVRSAATYVDKILKGAKPADLPVEQPTKFELVINMKTAKALGLTIPQSLLQRADEVIQ